ncbi:MAG: lycopene cyclase family protein [Pseudomonadota bacterium]
MTNNRNDIIIAGGGLAGMATAYYLKKYVPQLKVKLLEQRSEYSQDKHWSFWLDKNTDFDFAHIIHQSYQKWCVGIDDNSICNSERFSYSVIRSADWYADVLSVINDVVEFNVTCEMVSKQEVTTNKGTYRAPMIINALPIEFAATSLYQQFNGYLVKSSNPAFNPDCATLMDFSISQPSDNNRICSFMYVLPFNTQEALVEPTVFTRNTISQQWFEDALSSYMTKKNIENWSIVETESGMLPLGFLQPTSDSGFPIGTRAGWIRPSTGYAFLNSLSLAKLLAKEIATTGALPKTPYSPYSKSAKWMDRIFLEVMQQSPHLLPNIFNHWFKYLPADDMVKFMQDSVGPLITARLILNTPHKRQFMRQLWMS